MAYKPVRLDLGGKIGAIGNPQAFIVHHTAGRGSVQGVIDTLRARHLGVQYIMDRDGSVYQVGGPGESQMKAGWGPKGRGLSNANTVGMEVIARDDSDVTPAQVAAARQFISGTYPGIAVYGHGQVNPGHKQATEGMTIVNAMSGLPPPAVVRTPQQAVDQAPFQPQQQMPAQMAMPMPTQQPQQQAVNPFMQAIFGGNDQDWLQNKSYSVNALAGDFLAGHSPIRRFLYQKLMGI